MRFSRVFSYFFLEEDVEKFIISKDYEVVRFRKYLIEHFGKEVIKECKIPKHVLTRKIALGPGDDVIFLSKLSHELELNSPWGIKDLTLSYSVDNAARKEVKEELTTKIGRTW